MALTKVYNRTNGSVFLGASSDPVNLARVTAKELKAVMYEMEYCK